MKLKEVFYMLGAKPRPRRYGHAVRSFSLPRDGTVHYAQWLHPRETEKAVTAEAVEALRQFLSPGDAAIDIGAHTGDSTLPIALAVGATGCVLAFEPNHFVFPILQTNAEINPGKTNIVPCMFAVTETDGPIEFQYSDSGFCNGGHHEGMSRWRHGHAFNLRVEGVNLERFLKARHPDVLPRLRYIKIDTEGYDCTVLQSISRILAECRPYVKAEVFKRTRLDKRRELLDAVRRHGYTVHRWLNEANYRGEIVTEDRLMAWEHYDIFCVPN
jgi:FkbM family methyltransferase